MRVVRLCAVLLLAASLGGAEDGAPTDSFLALGVRQYAEGNFEEAVFSLDTAVRKLAARRVRQRELARAYLYQGATYVALQHEEAAKAKFRRALAADPALNPAPEEFSVMVRELFEAQRLERSAAQRSRKGKRFLAVGGIGAAGAIGFGLSHPRRELPANRPPGGAIAVDPPGTAIVGATRMTFQGSGADADGDALTYSWDLGDGTRATGTTVSHVYQSPGEFRVSLTLHVGAAARVKC